MSLFFFLVGSSMAQLDNKVLLKSVNALTLRSGLYTTGRRSSPIPQLNCVGGTAGCSAYVPSVIQCENKGSDGVDIQWECKADLDNSYRFGVTNVACEGYDYPDDPYILVGSCGVEYTLDLTKDGYVNRHSSNIDYDGRNDSIIPLIFAGLILFAIIGTCTSPSPGGYRSYNSGPGFWSGAATGAALGSMYGRSHRGYGSNYGNSTSWRSSRSTGTRTASGFGGTRRR